MPKTFGGKYSSMITKTPKLEYKSLYEVLMLTGHEDMDICDSVFDWGSNMGCYKSFEDCNDYYDKLMLLFCLNITCTKVNEKWYSCCDISRFISEHQDTFDKFMNEENREGYRPQDYSHKLDYEKDEDFYDLYLNTFESLIIGNYAESDYQKLYEMLIKESENDKAVEKKTLFIIADCDSEVQIEDTDTMEDIFNALEDKVYYYLVLPQNVDLSKLNRDCKKWFNHYMDNVEKFDKKGFSSRYEYILSKIKERFGEDCVIDNISSFDC